MELSVIYPQGAAPAQVADVVFDAPFNEGLVHQIVVAYQANARTASAHQKNRAAVRGGGRKPWRQKGTGRARAGTIRSPLWRGGGKVFPAGGEHYAQKVNKKMYRAAMRAIVSELRRQERLVVVEEFGVTEPRTRVLLARLAELAQAARPLLLVSAQPDLNLTLAARNLPWVEVCAAAQASPVALIRPERVIASRAALAALEERLA